MTDEKKYALAKQVYQTLCDVIENREWKFEKEEDDFIVHFGVRGDDLPMNFILVVDVERQLIRLMSPLPFNMDEDKRIEGAIATCAATYRLVDGSFDYDLSDGQIVFRMTASFRDSMIGEGLFDYMIDCSCFTVDEYNELFFALDAGVIDIEDFLKKE